MLEALVNRQDNYLTGASQPAMVEHASQIGKHTGVLAAVKT
jgi:hypothetical protein